MERFSIKKAYIPAGFKEYLIIFISTLTVTYLHFSVPEKFHFIHILHYYLYYLVVIYASIKIGFLGGFFSAMVISFLYDYEVYLSILSIPHYKLRSFIEILMLYTVGVFTGFFAQKLYLERLKLENTKHKLASLLDELQNSISEKMKMEKELARIDRLRLMGEISASIAHEVRNPLSAIKSSAKYMKENGFDEELLDIIIKESNQLENFIYKFNHFIRKSDMNKENIVLADFFKELEDYMKMYLKDKKVSYQIDIKSSLKSITTDRIALKHILLNLIVNAFESVSDTEDGKVTISVENDDNYIYFIVKDNGRGVSEHEQNSIFEPFYTTKKDGTGLGLSISLKLSTELNGNISVENDNGAKFTLRLPL